LWKDREHYSEEWDDAPMPYSVFFTKQGHAIHGTYEVRHLGQPVSHGCVRLSVKNASILWDLVKQHKMANTMVVLTGEIPGGGMAVARDFYGLPRVFFGRERTYYPPQRRYYGGFPFGW
jgi:hypothetical protein